MNNKNFIITNQPEIIDINYINEIEVKYHFEKDFDLKSKLNTLPTRISLYKKHKENICRPSSIGYHLKLLKNLSENMKQTLSITPLQIKVLINQALENNLKSEIDNWSIFQFIDSLDIFHNTCLIASKKVDKDIGGRKNYSIPQYIILSLAAMYENGTGKKPTCGWNDGNGTYVGSFYEFILDLIPLLKMFRINVGTKQTIGKYTVKILGHYKKLLKEMYTELPIPPDA